MAIDPWIYAVHHFVAGVNAQYATGDGALTTIAAGATLVSDSALGRVLLRCPGANSLPVVMATKQITPATELVFGVRIQCEAHSGNTSAAGHQNVIEFRNASGELLNITRERTSTRMYLRRGSTVLADIISFPLGVNLYLEAAIGFHASTGYLKISVDGIELINYTAQNTANVAVGTGCSVIQFTVPPETSSSMRVTDFYVKDVPVSGTPYWGPIAPKWRTVTADVGASGFTPDTGSDLYARLQTMTGYIEATAIADYAEFELSALPAGVGTIIAQVGVTVAEAPLGGAPAIAHDLHYGSDTTAVAGLVTGSTAPRTQARVHLTQPNGSPWTAAAAAGGSGGSKLLLTAV